MQSPLDYARWIGSMNPILANNGFCYYDFYDRDQIGLALISQSFLCKLMRRSRWSVVWTAFGPDVLDESARVVVTSLTRLTYDA